jgi:hypothetical protein
MGKSTLVTRRGYDNTLSRPGSAAVVKNILVARQQCETTALWAAGCQRAKAFWSGNSLRLSTQGSLFCPFGR